MKILQHAISFLSVGLQLSYLLGCASGSDVEMDLMMTPMINGQPPRDLSENDINRRELQNLLELRWNISKPDFSYIDHEFILEWRVSDYVQDRFATFTVYDGWDCKAGNNDITDTITDYNNNDVYFQNLGLQPDPNTPPASGENAGLGSRDMALFLAIEPIAAESPIFYYTESEDGAQLRGRMDFCVRFSLYNEDPALEDSVEVNFQETLIAFYADLTDGFNITDVTVTPSDEIEKDAYVACEIIAYECDRQNQRLENPGYLRDQGNEVRVCVELSEASKLEKLYLDRIIWFYFHRTYDEGDVVRQNAIIPDSLPALSGLTDYDCLRGIEVCGFDTILRAEFFRYGVGAVYGVGEGLCQFGGTSYLVEDVPKVIGDRLGWIYHDHQTAYATRLNITGFPVGSTVWYNDTNYVRQSESVDDEGYELILIADNDARLRFSLDSLEIQAPLHSDVDFILDVLVRTTAGSNHLYQERVAVLAVADPPQVTAVTPVLQLEEDGDPVLVQVDPDRSDDEDNSESLSVRIMVPMGADGKGWVGTIIETSSMAGISTTGAGTGTFTVFATGPDPASREETLDAYLASNIAFQPREHWAGVLLNETGLLVRAISTEAYDVAPSNSEADGTLGDMDTRTEVASTYIDVIVVPVNDLPYLTNTQTIVQENKNNTDVDLDVILPIGQEMGITCDDLDGSQSMDAILTGFPPNLRDLSFGISIDGVSTSADIPTGRVTIAGDNNTAVLLVLESLHCTLAHDDDANFLVVIDGTSSDRPVPNPNNQYEVSGPFHLEHLVIVEAVADTPIVNVGASVKELSAEQSGFKSYPVTVGLQDDDGSETFQGQEVTITYYTPTNIAVGADPLFDFPTSPDVTITYSGDNEITVTGDGPALVSAMQDMMIKPGEHNGEDIAVTITVTSFESNPTEPGEVAVPTVTSVETFVIPIDPVIQGEPTLTSPTAASGREDTQIELPTVEVGLDGIEDSDKSEAYYVEVLRSSFHRRTKFYIDGKRTNGEQVGDWLRLPNPTSSFKIKPPNNFSGMIDMSLRARITDYTNSGNATKTTDPQTVTISVSPVADGINFPPESTVGVEDLGPLSFGSTLNSVTILDDGSGGGNNPDTETISQVQLVVPQDTASLTYTISGTFAPTESGTSNGDSTCRIEFDDSTRTYSLTSTILTGAVDTSAVSIEDREAAEQDIRSTLDTFMVEIGPDHNDLNGIINVTITTLDVNIGEFDAKIIDFDHDVIILAVADAGGVFTHETVQVFEDGEDIPLKIDVSRSADGDNSETLSVRIKVPSDSVGPIGTIVGTTPSGVSLASEGNGKYLVTTTSTDTTPAERETLLNSFLSLGDLAFNPRENVAGNATLQVDVISTEAAAENEVAPGEYGGSDNDSKTETVTDYIQISVRPVVDNPDITMDGKVKSNAVGPEDTYIQIPLSVTLTDNDGSETYVIEVDGDSLPQNAALFGENGDLLEAFGGIYTLQPADVANLQILPPLHWSSEYQGDIVLQSTTIVTDSTFGFDDTLLSIPMNITVQVNEVSDQPESRDVHVVANEDEDYPIGVFVEDLASVLVDKDGSETLSLVLGGLPANTIAKTTDNAGLSYLGDGEWQVDEAMIPSLVITPKKNYAGDNPYPNLKFRAVSQEVDGHESSRDWDVSFSIYPIADGFNKWEPKVSLSEKDIEDGTGVHLNGTILHTLADPDSEYVIEYYFDFSSLIADAGIGVRLVDLTGVSGAGLDELVAGYLQGTFDYNSAEKKITVAAANIQGIVLSPDLFLDSNVDFNIPVSALVEDAAMIYNTRYTDDIVQYATFKVDLVGTADVPSIHADDIRGDCRIPANLGGDVTDTDVLLGRLPSEEVTYIVSTLYAGALPGYTFTDGNNNVVGYAGGDGTWMLTKADLNNAELTGGLFFSTQRQSTQEAEVINERNLQDTTPVPTDPPTEQPTPGPTDQPTSDPTPDPTPGPTDQPTSDPTPDPTPGPTDQPTSDPTPAPTSPPTTSPTESPVPSVSPTESPSTSPAPSAMPSSSPTVTAAEYGFMVIATENDGHEVTVSTTFDVVYWDQSQGADDDCPGHGLGPRDPPLPPDVIIGPNIGVEDTDKVLEITANAAASDLTNPTVSVVVSQWPEGLEFKGNFRRNHVTGAWVAPASDVNGGGVTIIPPADFSGYLDITVEVIAVNSYFKKASTGEFNVTMFFDPVADGPEIKLPNTEGYEDQVTPLPITVSLLDVDGSEELNENVYVKIGDGDCWLNEVYPSVSPADSDASIDGIPVTSYFRIPINEIQTLTMSQSPYWHGVCPVSVVAQTIETFDDPIDPDRTATLKADFNVHIQAVANPPIITYPENISGLEDTFIPIVGLSISTEDTNQKNGHEILSAVFSDVPTGTEFEPGTNGGNGLWTIPLEELANVKVKAPTHYSGVFTMTFTALSKELDGGDEQETSGSIQVNVISVADNFYTLAYPVTLQSGGAAQPLDLFVRMDDTRGVLPGEVPEETISITFTSVPTGLDISTTQGGIIAKDESTGDWTFSGTQDQSNALQISGVAPIGVYNVDMSAVTIDGSSVYTPPKTDYFNVNVTDAPVTSTTRALSRKAAAAPDARALQEASDIFDDEQGIRHCDSEVTVLWDSASGSFPLPSISITEQSHLQVTFDVSYDMSSDVNWVALLHAAETGGENTCDNTIGDSPTTITANCYDYRARAYLYVNINNAPEDMAAGYVPKKCDPPLNMGDTKTVVYALTIPCSACSSAARLDGGNATTRLLSMIDSSTRAGMVDSATSALGIAASSDSLGLLGDTERSLQDDNGELPGPANKIDIEFIAVTDDEETAEPVIADEDGGLSAGAIFGIIVMVMALCCCLAFIAFKRFRDDDEEEKDENTVGSGNRSSDLKSRQSDSSSSGRSSSRHSDSSSSGHSSSSSSSSEGSESSYEDE